MNNYAERKSQFDNMITLYGRKPVLEVLRNNTVSVFRLHVADSNKEAEIISEICQLAEDRNIEIRRHSKQELSRISKNGRQDQGVAIDVDPPNYQQIENLPETVNRLIVLDQVTNPQNLGMVIRSVAASPIDGLVLPRSGCAKIDPLVYKASAGTLLHANIYRAGTLRDAITKLKRKGFVCYALTGAGELMINQPLPGGDDKHLFVLGNESTGLSEESLNLCDHTLSIPLKSDIESLNVAAAATLVAFSGWFR